MTSTYVQWKAWEPSRFGEFSHDDAVYFASELREAGVSTVRGLRIAEIGFGNGSFAGWVRASGGIWVGREALPELREAARQKGFQIGVANASFANEFGADAFDLLVAFDVLEHLGLDEIRAVLLEAKTLLKSGGVALFRVPSGDSPFAGSIFFGDLTHQTLLGSSAFRQLADDASLRIAQIRSPKYPILGGGIAKASRRSLVWLVRFAIYKLVGRILIGDASSVISPNMVVVLRKE